MIMEFLVQLSSILSKNYQLQIKFQLKLFSTQIWN